MVYDSLLLLAIFMIAGFAALSLTHGEAIPSGTLWFRAYLLGVAALFFCGFWLRGGQTLGLRAWRLRVQGAFQDLSQDPVAAEQEAFRNRLGEIMHHMEQLIEATLDRAADGQLSDQDGENFYRLLGAYRGVSEAMVDYAGTASAIDWDRWREARF